MAVSDKDVWIAANQLIKMFGEDASLIAAQRADKAIEAGDPFNEKLWTRVTAAVRELQRSPSNEEALN